AGSHLRTLVTASGDDPRYLTFYIRFLLTQKQVSEAEAWFGQLEKKFPQEINTLALATDIAFANKRYDTILPAIEAYLSKIKGSEAERYERTRLVASLLEANAERLNKTASQKLDEGAGAAAQEWAPQFLARAEALYRSNTEALPKNALAQSAF